MPVRTSIGLAPAAAARLQVAQRIADDRYAVERDLVVAGEAFEQARLRLAAATTVIGAVRADDNPIDTPALGLDEPPEFPVHGRECPPVEKPAGETGLVRRDRDRETGPGQAGNGCGGAGIRQPLARRFYEIP